MRESYSAMHLLADVLGPLPGASKPPVRGFQQLRGFRVRTAGMKFAAQSCGLR
jgi:hypothetical protein